MTLSPQKTEPIEELLERALRARENWWPEIWHEEEHAQAARLFNGFSEGNPYLVVDLYGDTLVLFNHTLHPEEGKALSNRAAEYLRRQLPWIKTVILKKRNSSIEQERRGIQLFGGPARRKVRENGVWHAIDLTLNLDASLYLDTRNLRAWAQARLAGRRVLNTFAYTGSLGTAALAGGARQVIQMDRNPRFLRLARESYALNGLPIQPQDFWVGDFWVLTSRLIRSGELFDCVFVDPPFFSQTSRGRIDMASQAARVINKVRPLVGDGGSLVVVNNALFLSGADYLRQLQELCSDGYLSIEELVPVPPDFTGFPETISGLPGVDPAPFNHATKIAILRVRRKDGQSA